MFVKSKISHDVINTSWCQKVRKYVKNTSWWQKVRYYFTKFVITSKSVKSSSWRTKVLHDIQNRSCDKNMSKVCHEIKNTSWCQKVCHEVKTCHDVNKFIIPSKRKASIMTLKSQKVRHDVTKFVKMSQSSSWWQWVLHYFKKFEAFGIKWKARTSIFISGHFHDYNLHINA